MGTRRLEIGEIEGVALAVIEGGSSGKDVSLPTPGDGDDDEQDMEITGNDSGADLYQPDDPDEQRRAWVLQTVGCDWDLDNVMKAAEWLKTGQAPPQRGTHVKVVR
jgi:hypothetical protein